MGFDLHAALLLLLAFVLGGGVAFLVRRRMERRRMSLLARAALMSLDEGDLRPPVRAAEPSPPPAPVPGEAPSRAPEEPHGGITRAARPRRGSHVQAADDAPPPPHVPHDMVPLAPADPELPLGLPEAPPPKPKRPRARPVPVAEIRPSAPARPAAPGAAAGTATPPPLLAAPEGAADDLKRLKGIGPQNEQRLNALGIYHLRQIAAWSPEEVRWVGAALAFPGRIEREAWVAQAKALLAEPPPEA